MAIDMAQFHQVFFEESFEGLDAMESGLLNLDLGAVNADAINTIFRAAHSIKGGSGTFGFMVISDFTHVMETLLDDMRNGRRQVTQSVIDVLLGSVDCLRDMLLTIQAGAEVDHRSVASHKQLLDNALHHHDLAAEEMPPSGQAPLDYYEQSNSQDTALLQIAGWHIRFRPHVHLLKTGNEPLRILRELATLGNLTVSADCRNLPDLYCLDPEECHLSWNLDLQGQATVSEIDEIFDWVEADCDLTKQPILATTQHVNPSPAAYPG
jgi:two-component system chemotaxis sensor kinase CheA